MALEVREQSDRLLELESGEVRDPDRVNPAAYDVLYTLSRAVTGWTYEGVEPSEETVRLLDGRTRDWLHEEIIRRNVRPPANASASSES